MMTTGILQTGIIQIPDYPSLIASGYFENCKFCKNLEFDQPTFFYIKNSICSRHFSLSLTTKNDTGLEFADKWEF